MHFLRYSTGELGMISELIFCRPIVKILIYHFTISILVIGPFPEISGKFRGNIRNFPGNFPEISQNFPHPPYPPPYPTYPSLPTHPLPLPIHPLPPYPQLQVDLSRECVFCAIPPFFPPPFIYNGIYNVTVI